MHVNIPYCIYNCLPEDETTRFETCRRHQKLNINLENCVFRWFVLYNCITMHGAKNVKYGTAHCGSVKGGTVLSSSRNVNFSQKSTHYEVKLFRPPATEFPRCYRIHCSVSNVKVSVTICGIENASHSSKYI